MKKLTFYLLLYSLIGGCTTVHRIKSNRILASAKVESSSFYSEVPFEYVSNLPIFEVFIEGKKYRFIFDTGGYTVFSKQLISELSNVKKVSHIDVKDGNNTISRINTYVLDELQIGGASFSNVGFAKIGFTESEWFECLGLDGTIGPNIMKEALWKFENSQQRIVLTDNADRLKILKDGIKVPIRTDNVFKPSLEVQIGNNYKRIGFDTGFNGFLKLIEDRTMSVYDKYPSVKKLGSRSNAGNSTEYLDTRMIKLDSLRLNNIVFTNIFASVGEQYSSDLLGSRIFDYYNVLIDLSGKALYLEEIEGNDSLPSSIDSFGFGLDFRNGKVVIDYVYQPSSALEKGLEPGQIVEKINGQRLTFSNYCDFIENFDLPKGDTIKLGVLQNNTSKIVALKKEKIL